MFEFSNLTLRDYFRNHKCQFFYINSPLDVRDDKDIIHIKLNVIIFILINVRIVQLMVFLCCDTITTGDNMRIKQVIVVEGKNDTNVLKSYFDCDTIETHGTHLGKEILAQIALAKEKRGVIIFTDPDYPGEKIRTTINQKIDGCQNAYIEKNKAKTSKKVGVEHATKADLEEALSHLFTYESDAAETLSYDDYIALGFNGCDDAMIRRCHIAKKLHLGKPNAKTLYKRLNMLRLCKEDIIKLMEDLK